MLRIQRLALLCGASAAAFFLMQTPAQAAAFTSSQSGNFNIGTTWGGACAAACTQGVDFPGTADSMTVANGHTVTVTATPAQAVTAITINNGGILTINNTFTLTGTGNYTNNGTNSGGGALTLTGAGTTIDGTGSNTLTGLTTLTNNKTIQGTANLSFAGALTISAGTVTNNGTISVAGTMTVTGTMTNNGTASTLGTLTGAGTWNQGANSILNASGATTNAMAVTTVNFSASSNTVNYALGGNQTCKNAQYYNLRMTGSGTKTCTTFTSPILGNIEMGGTAAWTLASSVTVNGGILASGGTLTTGAFQFWVTGASTLSGGTVSLTSDTGSKVMVGLVTVSGGTLSGASTAIVFRGGLTRTSGSVSITGTATFNTNNQALSGTMSITTLTVAAGITLTNNGTLTTPGVFTVTGSVTNNGTVNASSTLTGGGSWTQGLDSVLNASGATTNAMAVTTVNFSASSNTVNYALGGNQTCKNAQYYNLRMTGSGTKTCTTFTSPILGNIEMGGTAAWTLASSVTVNGGILASGGTLTTGAFQFWVTGASTLSGGTVSLTSDTGSKLFAGLVTVSGGTLSGASTAIVFRGGLTRTSGSVAITGTATFNTNNQALSGTMSITTLTVAAGITLTNNGTLTTPGVFTVTGSVTNNGTVNASSTLTGGGSWTQGLDSVLNASGATTNAMAVTTVNFSASSNTVNYALGGNQTCKNAQYYNLRMTGSGTKTCTTFTSPILGNIEMGGTAAWTLASSVTVNGGILASGGTLTTGAFQFWVTGASTLSGGTVSLTSDTGSKLFAGLVTVSGGTLSGASTAIVFRGGLTRTSGSVSITGTATFNTNNQALSGTMSITTLTVAAGITLTNNGTLTTPGVFTVTGSVTNNGTVNTSSTLTGGGSWTQGLDSVLNASGATTNAMAVTTVNFSASSNTVNYALGGNQTCKNAQYYNLRMTGSGTKTCTTFTSPILGNIEMGGTAAWTLASSVTVNGGILASGGTLTTGAFQFWVTGASTLSGGTVSLTSDTGSKVMVGLVTVSGGTLSGASALIVFRGGLTRTSGSVAITGTATFNTNNQALSGTMSITTLTVAAGITLTNNGTLTTPGVFTVTGSVTNNGTVNASSTLTGGGSWTQGLDSVLNASGATTNAMAVTTVNFSASSNTVNYALGGNQTCKNAQYYNLRMTGSGTKTCTTFTSPIVGNLTLGGSMVWTLGSDIAIDGDFIISGGTMNTNANSYRVDLGGDMQLNSGAFTVNRSTVALTGSSAQTITNAGLPFWVLIDSNTSSGGVTFASSFTATKLMINRADLANETTVYFNANSTFTITTLSLAGASGKKIWLRSTVDDTNWYLNNTGTNSITYVDVRDSDARAGSIIQANDGGSQNSGNNYNWYFGSGGQTRTWWGTVDTNWWNPSNWESGVPSTDDYVLIVSTALVMPVPTSHLSMAGLTITGSLTTAGYNFTVYGPTSLSGTLTLTNATGNKTFNGTVTVGNGGILNTDTGTVVFNDAVTVNSGGVLRISNTTGSKTFNGTLTVDGDLNVTAAETVAINADLVMNGTTSGAADTTFLPAFAKVGGGTISGTAGATDFGSPTFTTAYTNTASLNLATLTITGTTLTNQGTITVNTALNGTGGFTNAAGGTLNLNFTGTPGITTLTANASGNTVRYNFAGIQTCRNIQYYNLAFGGSGVKTCTTFTSPILGNIEMGGTAAWTLGSSVTVNGGILASGGTLTTGAFQFWVTGASTLSGGTVSLTSDTGSKLFAGLVTVSGGTLSGASTGIVFRGGLTRTSGSIAITGTATFNTNNQALSGTMSITTLTVAAGMTLTNNGTLTTPGVFTVTGSVTNNGTVNASSTLTGGGSWTQGLDSVLNASGATTNAMAVTTVDFVSSSNTVNYALAGAQTCKNAQYYNLTFSGSGAKTCTTFTSPIVGNLTLGGSMVWTLGSDIAISGDFVISGGTMNTNANSYRVDLGGDMQLNSGAFTVNRSTVALTGSSAQTITNAGLPFWVLIDSNTSSGGVTFASSFTATKLMINRADLANETTVYFNANSTFTITTLSLVGASGKKIWLRSTIDDTNWYLNNTGTSSGVYVDVRDSDARSGRAIVANDGTSVNSGNNFFWSFLTGQIRTWWGAVDTNWWNWSNWDEGYPTSQDSVLIVSTATFMPVPTAAVTISSLTVRSGSTLTTAGFDFTANGSVDVYGTLTLTNATGNKTFNKTVTIGNGGILNTDTGTSIFVDVQVDAGGTLQIPSTTGSKTFNDTLTVDGDFNVTAAETVNINGNLVMNGTTSGAAATTFLPAFAKVGGGTISGTAGATDFGSPTFTTAYTNTASLNLATLTITGTTLTNQGTVTVNTALSGTGGFTNAAGGTLNLNFTGTPGITTLTANASGNTVRYNFAGVQTCRLTNYDTLELGNSGAKTCALVGGANNVQNITLSGTASWSLSAASTISGTLTVGNGTTVTKGNNAAVNFGAVDVSGTLSVTTTLGSVVFGTITVNNGGLVNFTAAEPTSVSGDLQVDGTGSITSNTGLWTFNKVGGGGSLSGTATSVAITNATFSTAYTNSVATLSVGGTLTINEDFVNDSAGVISAATINIAGTKTLTNNGSLTASGVVTVTGAVINNGTVNASSTLTGVGSWTQGLDSVLNASGATTNAMAVTTVDFVSSSNTVNYALAGAQTCKNAQYYNLTFSGSGAKTCTTFTSPIVGNLTLGGSMVWTLGSDIAISGDFVISGGTMNTNANSYRVDLGGDMQLNSGAFTVNRSTVALTGSSAQTITNAGLPFWVLIDSNTSSGGVTFASSFTATKLMINRADLANETTVYFNANSTFTITTLSLVGASGKKIWLRSTIDDTNWYLNNTGTSSGVYVDVRDSDARSGRAIVANDGTSVNSGNNFFWSFLTGQIRTWWGAVDTNWWNWSNWDEGYPTSQDSVLIVSTATFMPVPTAAVTISSLTVRSGSTLTTAGFDFTANGSVDVYGTLTLTNATGNKTFNKTVTIGNGGILNTDTGTSIFVDVQVDAGGTLQIPSTTGSKTFNDTLTVDGDFNVTAAETVNINGNLVMNGTTSGAAATTFLPAFAKVGGGTISGTAGATDFGSPTFTTAYTNTASLNLATLTITGTTLTNQGTITVNTALNGTGGFTNAAGGTLNLNFTGTPGITTLTANASGNTVRYNFAGIQTCRNIQYYNLAFGGSGVKTCTTFTSPILGNIEMGGTAAWTLGSSVTVNGGILASGGTLTTGAFQFWVTGASTLSGGTVSLTSDTGSKLFAGLVTVSGGTLSGASTGIVFRGGLTRTSGSIAITGTATFNTNNQALSGTMSITTLTVAAGMTLTNNGTLTTPGVFTVTGSVTNNGTVNASSTLTGGGSWTQGLDSVLNASGATTNAMAVTTVDFVSSSNTVNYALAGAQTCKNAQYYNLTFSGSGAKTCTTFTSPIVGNLTLGGSMVWTLGSDIAIDGDFIISGGTMNTNANSYRVDLGGDMQLNSGAFTVNRSTVALTGSSAQTITNAGLPFWVLIDSNTSSGGVTFASSFTATKLTVDGAGLASATTVYFNAHSTFTIANLVLRGSSGNTVWIRPTPPDQMWYLNNTSTNTVSYVDVAYSSASAGVVIAAGPDSIDSENNTNWTFVILSLSLSPSSYDFGSVPVASTVVSGSAIAVTNTGNVAETFSLSITTSGPTTVWGVGTALPTSRNTFAMFGKFNSVQPLSDIFSSTDIIISTPTASTPGIYGANQTGVSVPVSASRNLWLRLDTPPTTSTTNQQQMILTVTATAP